MTLPLSTPQFDAGCVGDSDGPDAHCAGLVQQLCLGSVSDELSHVSKCTVSMIYLF